MFGQVYYYRTIRKIVQAFGSLFNDMVLVKYTNDTQVETHRLVVPLSYSGKENFLTRLLDNPGLAKPVEITLPRAAFEVTSYTYDPSRKLNNYISSTVPTGSGSAQQQFSPVPYNIGFELSIYVRNVEDGLQLVEQILPVFNPSYTLTLNYLPQMGITQNMPVTLDGVTCSTQYEGDAKAEERIIIWTLGFTVQAQIYGPITTGNTIKQTITTLNSSDSIGATDYGSLPAQITVTMANTGFLGYQQNEVVYQGANLPDASATGTVSHWDPIGHILTLTNVRGSFVAPNPIVGTNSYGQWAVASTSPNITLANVSVTVNPPTANADSDYGFTTVITEFPATE